VPGAGRLFTSYIAATVKARGDPIKPIAWAAIACQNNRLQFAQQGADQLRPAWLDPHAPRRPLWPDGR